MGLWLHAILNVTKRIISMARGGSSEITHDVNTSIALERKHTRRLANM